MANSEPTTDGEAEEDALSLGRLAVETTVVTILLVGAVVVAGYLFRSPLEEMARWLIEVLGYLGIFVGVFLADAFTVPIPVDVYLFLSIASGASVTLTLVACSTASVLAGNLAYAIGPYIERIPILRSRLEDFRPRGEFLFQKWGGRAVALAALTPIPFSIVGWLAGIYRTPYHWFAAATLARVPRIVGYYALYAYGWTPAAI